MVFDTLYLLLSFGHESSEEAERLDPPFSYFRIRLICSLLETCGQFFNKGLAKKRLDRFLTYFQRYALAKPPLPLDVEFDVQVSSMHIIYPLMKQLHLQVSISTESRSDILQEDHHSRLHKHQIMPQIRSRAYLVVYLQLNLWH